MMNTKKYLFQKTTLNYPNNYSSTMTKNPGAQTCNPKPNQQTHSHNPKANIHKAKSKV